MGHFRSEGLIHNLCLHNEGSVCLVLRSQGLRGQFLEGGAVWQNYTTEEHGK